MKVLFSIKGLYQAAGGAERVICDICSQFADHGGHDVSLITFDQSGTPPFYNLSSSVKLIQLGIGDPRKSTSLILMLRRMVALRKVVRNENPDVVVGFMHSIFIPMAFALAGTKIPVIASEHIVINHYRKRRIQLLLFMMIVPLVYRITVLSDRIASHYPYWIRRKMISITNPISSVFRMVEPLNINDSSRTILSIGRFSKRKNHITLIRAFATFANEFPEWTLKILGDGVLRQEIESEVASLNLQNRVFLPGVVSNVAHEISNASFFALASLYESFGLVFAEAMACGKASVAFADCQGANEVIEHGKTGILVSGEDRVTAMADGLRHLIVNVEERNKMAILAKKRVFERFSVELIYSQWEDLLYEAADQNKSTLNNQRFD